MGILKRTNQSTDALVKVEGIWSLVEIAKSQWPWVLTVFAGGGSMSYLSAITEWMKFLGPLGWGLGFFLGCILVLLVGVIWESLRYRRLRSRQVDVSLSRGFNPLLTRFEMQRIFLPEMFNPEYLSSKNKEFIDCDLHGPALLLATGCNFSGVEFSGCQIVICREDIAIRGGVTRLKDSTIIRGSMRNITLLMSQDHYDDLPTELKANVILING